MSTASTLKNGKIRIQSCNDTYTCYLNHKTSHFRFFILKPIGSRIILIYASLIKLLKSLYGYTPISTKKKWLNWVIFNIQVPKIQIFASRDNINHLSITPNQHFAKGRDASFVIDVFNMIAYGVITEIELSWNMISWYTTHGVTH